MSYTPERLANLDEELVYWNELGDLVGWRVYGISYKKHASFWTNKEGTRGCLIEMTGDQRDDLVRAIRSGGKQ